MPRNRKGKGKATTNHAGSPFGMNGATSSARASKHDEDMLRAMVKEQNDIARKLAVNKSRIEALEQREAKRRKGITGIILSNEQEVKIRDIKREIQRLATVIKEYERKAKATNRYMNKLRINSSNAITGLNRRSMIVLGLDRSSTLADARKQHKRLIFSWHPDKGGDHDTFIKIQEAFRHLRNTYY